MSKRALRRLIAVTVIANLVLGIFPFLSFAAEKSLRGDFNLTSMCRPDDFTAGLRVTNHSNKDQAYTLVRLGSNEKIEGVVKANKEALVKVKWRGANDTWKLQIDGHSFIKAIGNNGKCGTGKPDRALFNLISNCRIDDQSAQFRIQNRSDKDYKYNLVRVGGNEKYEGVAKAGQDSVVKVTWTSPGDTWKLEIAGHTFTKTADNNIKCKAAVTPPRADFNLISMCRPDHLKAKFRIQNKAGKDYDFTLTRFGDGKQYNGTVNAGSDAYVEVPWSSSKDTWKLSIGGHAFIKVAGDNKKCKTDQPPGDGSNGNNENSGNNNEGNNKEGNNGTGGPLPKTATDYIMNSLLGLGMFALGAFALQLQNKSL
ncbi:hypothetical protein ACFO25_20575 [Paenactinomyces guangxiensis]|uniref:Uncharacterized protein n=1 Tax=Paenactinomyces guangxiensis TaxID=1490290 RepID=A0A7W2A9V4_9BACL|nr:hypothetical protein [Paenactinomyces guangxiensis]MBA4496130.1 hypothetical protein [Paenactinomyces guangxiensis]MBH8593218.1 hypothetical protein [Paenactinomyces guangxiensis]